MEAQTKDGKHKKANTRPKSVNGWSGGYEGWSKTKKINTRKRSKEREVK